MSDVHIICIVLTLTSAVSLVVMFILCTEKHRKQNGDRPATANRNQNAKKASRDYSATMSKSQYSEADIQLQNLLHHHQIPDQFTFPRQNLTFRRVLGDGQYGVVHLAEAVGLSRRKEWTTNMFAVKTVKDEATPSDKIDFLHELDIMKRLKPHPNILRLIGCCIEREPFLIIVEYVANGNLLELLERNRTQYINPSSPGRHPSLANVDQRTLLMMAKDVANGMDFLAYQKCIHRDLAARNVLVGSDFKCKVSDFGRACLGTYVIDSGMKFKGPLPIRWMAVESLMEDIHTFKSDVWAYGVLLWEITTLGARPYDGMPPKQVVEYVRDGFRLQQPQHCASDLYSIMMACWSTEPEKRPNFSEISASITNIVDLNTDYVQLSRIDRRFYGERNYFDPFEVLDM